MEIWDYTDNGVDKDKIDQVKNNPCCVCGDKSKPAIYLQKENAVICIDCMGTSKANARFAKKK
jgi:hypothetical protein